MKIVIIGAGVAGLGIGWRLKQKGADVTLLERAQPALGATWASAGMLAIAGELGAEETEESRFARHARALWPGFAAELEDFSGLPIGYRENGALIVSLSPEDALHLEERGLVRLDPATARTMEPLLSASMVAALFAPDEAQVNSRALGSALARAFVRAGGTLRTNEAALRIESGRGRVHAVHTAVARYEADAFIIAAGAWSGQIEGLPPEAVPRVRPVKGQMIALAAPHGARLPEHVVWGAGVYLVPRDGQLLVGATGEDAGFDASLTQEAADWLSASALRVMPELKAWRLADHWAGLRPGSADGLPLLGPSGLDGLYVASGQYRNGILYAPAVAELLARLVLEPDDRPLPFDPRRFSNRRIGGNT